MPLMAPGVAGVLFTVTLNVRGVDEPQALFAVTDMVPLLALAVALMVFVVDVPPQPFGNTQL